MKAYEKVIRAFINKLPLTLGDMKSISLGSGQVLWCDNLQVAGQSAEGDISIYPMPFERPTRKIVNRLNLMMVIMGSSYRLKVIKGQTVLTKNTPDNIVHRFIWGEPVCILGPEKWRP